MADDSGIDPRHPAQFQRGYDPSTPPEAPGTDAPVRPRGPVRLAGGPVATAERVPPPPARRPDPVVATDQDAAEADSDADDLGRRSRWEISLLVGGAALMLLAVGATVQTLVDTGYYMGGPQDSAEAFLRTLRWLLPQPAMTAGALAVVAGLTLQALRRPQ